MTETSAGGTSATVLDARTSPTSIPNGPGVNHLGYRGRSDQQVPGWSRWWVITEVGVRRAWQSRWLRRMMIFAWLPAVWFGVGFFIWEQAAQYPEWRQMLTPFLSGMPRTPEMEGLRSSMATCRSEARHSSRASYPG